eukprot:TRINITY_DN1806_c0_g1_i3.p3 TRINITY_DN1806_c0_g1~~TRINITY_DN1806_c0_g1_i3.p3  ORF type:complete len:230 (-),score=61.68 TRINITY_DN1806_c0_g1_i3:77-766(-)
MQDHHFKQVTEAFVRSAENAIAAGFDFIELHGAHGYLLDSFISKKMNHRTDGYGGPTVAQRAVFSAEVVRAIRSKIGKDYPLIYRFSQWSTDDYTEIKLANPGELKEFADALVAAGINILHPSTRNALAPAFPDVDQTKSLAEWTREVSGVPVIGVGKTCLADSYRALQPGDSIAVTDPAPHLDLVNSGKIDLLAIGRSMLANPNWVKIVRDGDWHDLAEWRQELRGSS